MKMRTLAIVTAALLATACGAPETQQTEQAASDDAMTTETGVNAPATDDTAMMENLTAADYVTRAAMSDMYEIEAGRLAVKNGESPETRRFGQMMVNDHTKSSEDMKTALAAVSGTAPAPTRLDAEHQGMIDRLENAEGDAFDREYMAQQMAAHRKALALHQSYADDGEDQALKAFAQKVLPVIRTHHDRLNQMSGASAGSASGTTPGATTGTGSTGTGTTGTGTTGTGTTSTGGANR
jgi:putative membrane protein